jgi:hypothetical protein
MLPAADFNRRVRAAYAADWKRLTVEWREFVETLEYGHDIPRTAMRFAQGEPVPAEGRITKLRADLGWQHSGFQLEEGQTYRIRGKGRYQIAKTDRPWMAEPGGVTIRYWRGRPLGMLLGTVLDADEKGLSEPIALGLDRTFTPKRSGTLYLKVNDSPGELGDNAGDLLVHVVPVSR